MVVIPVTKMIKKISLEEDFQEMSSSTGKESTETDAVYESSSSSTGILWIATAFFFIITAAFGGVYLSKNGTEDVLSLVPKAPSPTTAPTEQPTPTAAEVDKKEYEIKVLNGSGTAGLAAKAKESLEEAGFSVSSVGNADTQDYSKTIIQSKKSVKKEFIAALEEELGKTYKLGENATQQDSEKDDIVVTLGKD